MLVKFRNDSQEFEDKVNKLKSVLGVGAASKVAEYAVSNFSDLDARYHKALDRIEKLLDEADELRSLVLLRDETEIKINKLLNKDSY